MQPIKVILFSFNVLFFVLNVNGQSRWEDLPKVEIYQLWELEVENRNSYNNPFSDVELLVQFKSRDGRIFNHFGFYDGVNKWKIRFSPDELGEWVYEYRFTGSEKTTKGEFGCIPSEKPGRVWKNHYNPFWLGKGRDNKTLFRSFHVGDRFFAENWDDPTNSGDGNKRTIFLDWLQHNNYNMISVASLFTNRRVKGRGLGWANPELWPLDVDQFRKLEMILDDLKNRDITVFPFAGLFGANGIWPVNPNDQELYIKTILARFGHYPNLILNIAGPEPFWREGEYQGAMRLADIRRLGHLIDSLDVHRHIITVHNEKRATKYGDPFISEYWHGMSTLQGPTTTNRDELFSGLIMNHPRNKPAYAQETLWPGNIYHPPFSNDQVRKNAYAILFSGSILNFADMEGESSSGFTGTLDLADCKQGKHEIVKKVWDWFETIPFSKLISRQDLVKHGFCLAAEGEEYYIYLDTIGSVEVYLDFPYSLQSEWLNAKNPVDKRTGPTVEPWNETNKKWKHEKFVTPDDGDDWILHIYAPKPEVVATGNFPDLTVDDFGNIHLVYNRSGLRYKKYDFEKSEWLAEQETGCNCEYIERSDPDIVVDSKENPHVYCGNEYAWFDGRKWNHLKTKGTRDSELAINSNDQLFLVSRGGNFNGNIGMETRDLNSEWTFLPDPDENGKSINDHVYSDLFVAADNTIHLVQRHGPVQEVTYRRSTDGGRTWPVEEAVSDDRGEAPHIVVDQNGKVIISTANGYVYERTVEGNWTEHGRKITSYARQQPELGIDAENNLYIAAFGGNYNTRYNGFWLRENFIPPVTENGKVGFVETAGHKNYAFIVWEEGVGDAEKGLAEDASIVVGIIYPDGRIIGLK